MIAVPLTAILIALCVAVSSVWAAEYPARPITIVVPFPPGSSSDLCARLLASTMAPIVNASVIVMNKPGAGGAIGAASVVTSQSDGYTLLLTSSSASIVPAVERAAGRQPPFAMNQLAPIALLYANPPVLLVKRAAPWSTAKQLLDDAGRRPERISYASPGINTSPHLATELLTREAGVTLKHVPYAGVAPALNDLMAGQVDAMLVVTPSMIVPHIQSGKLAPLLVVSQFD